ncbi:MAG TPA: host attachment protein [Chthoniobacteraceae bacterium]|nr:host attachment protein [Chthoniobacteraceae bacterium]
MIVLADLGRVKAFRVTYDMMTSKPQLEQIYDCEFPEAHGRLMDKVTDQAGRFALNGTPGAAIGENHNLRVETERRLVRLVAEKISELVQGERYWFLAAAEGINSRIVDLLPQPIRAALYKNIPADLVKTPKQQILDYFTTSAAA